MDQERDDYADPLVPMSPIVEFGFLTVIGCLWASFVIGGLVVFHYLNSM